MRSRGDEGRRGRIDSGGIEKWGRDEHEGAVGEEVVDGCLLRERVELYEREAAGSAESEHYGLFGGLPLGESFTIPMPEMKIAGGVATGEFLAVPGADAGKREAYGAGIGKR